MGIRSAIADLLEGIAGSLRAGVATVDAPKRRVVRADPVDPFPHPVGFWLCTLSTFDDFVVGHAYPAIRDGSSVRVHPYPGSSWAPYWQRDEGRFCYPEHTLNFTYLGAQLPSGHPVDVRTGNARIAARVTARAA